MLQNCSPTRHGSAFLNMPVPLFALDASDEHLPAHIQMVSREAIQFRIKSCLSSGRRLVMQYAGCRTELEVETCQQEEAGTYLIDCKVRSSHEGAVRDEWRMAVNWPAQVEVPGSKDRHKARVRDISVFGLGLQLAFQPELNSLLIVYTKSGVGLGRVKHCRHVAQNHYWAGLYLEEFRSEEQASQDSEYEGEKSPQSISRLLSRMVHSITGA